MVNKNKFKLNKIRNVESLEIQQMNGQGEVRKVCCKMEPHAKFGKRTKKRVISFYSFSFDFIGKRLKSLTKIF